jgi:hypothetical protein
MGILVSIDGNTHTSHVETKACQGCRLYLLVSLWELVGLFFMESLAPPVGSK